MIDAHVSSRSTAISPTGLTSTAAGALGVNHSVATCVFGEYARSTVPAIFAVTANFTYWLISNVPPAFFCTTCCHCQPNPDISADSFEPSFVILQPRGQSWPLTVQPCACGP